MMRSTAIAAGALAALLAGSGCSTRGVYRANQDWQRTECRRLPDADERERCVESTETSYEEYRRARERARSADGGTGAER